MPRPWTEKEREKILSDLERLYVLEGKTINEIGKILGVSDKTVFSRLCKFGIPSNPRLKLRQDINIPSKYTPDIAEFFGIMLGDGKLSHFQAVVTLGSKEMAYAKAVVDIMARIFGARPKIAIRKTGYKDVYIGSVAITRWLKGEGLVYNKVLAQVDVPRWIKESIKFSQSFLRGFFDTDGSVYALRWGCQIEFTNESKPLLQSVREMLIYLGYTPSRISGPKVYITRKEEVGRFFAEVRPRNDKHVVRFARFVNPLGR